MRLRLAGTMAVKSRIATGAVLFFCTLFLCVGGDMQAQAGKVLVRQPTRAALPAPAAGPTPSAPSSLNATGASNKRIDLTWSASTVSGGTISLYHIERCEGV